MRGVSGAVPPQVEQLLWRGQQLAARLGVVVGLSLASGASGLLSEPLGRLDEGSSLTICCTTAKVTLW